MVELLVFAISLLVAALLSELAGRTILSTSVLFLAVGIAGSGFGLIHVRANDPIVVALASTALVLALYNDAGMTELGQLIRMRRLPQRALLLGMPLTCLGVAALGHWLVELDWLQALLVGAILSPTDPVFAAGLVQSERIPIRLRHLLNVESGINDGLALPAIVLLMGELGGDPGGAHASGWHIALELAIGVGIGFTVSWLALALERSRYFAASHFYVPILGLAIILVVFALSRMIHANQFLAAFASGTTVASTASQLKERIFRLTEFLAEILKLAALLVFGALIPLQRWGEFTPREFIFALLVITLIRPAALELSLARSELSWRERLVAGWFGPRGFASVVFGLYVLDSDIPGRTHLFQLIALVVAGSIVLLSTTDVLAERWLGRAVEDRRIDG